MKSVVWLTALIRMCEGREFHDIDEEGRRDKGVGALEERMIQRHC